MLESETMGTLINKIANLKKIIELLDDDRRHLKSKEPLDCRCKEVMRPPTEPYVRHSVATTSYDTTREWKTEKRRTWHHNHVEIPSYSQILTNNWYSRLETEQDVAEDTSTASFSGIK